LQIIDGNLYEGYFVEGKKEGKGVMTYENQERYEGEWV